MRSAEAKHTALPCWLRLAVPLTLLLALATPLARAALENWSGHLLAYASQRFGAAAPARLQQMQATMRQIQAAAGRDARARFKSASDVQSVMPTLRGVNDYYNHVPYFSDQEHWGVPDYWATPVEFVASWGGDCEDYAIAKYMALKELGIPVERLRITYVRATNIGETHMVLAYYPTPSAEPWILDNLNDTIQLASARTDLVPVYSFNDEDLWLASGHTRKGGASTVRLWKELIEKMQKEQQL